MNDFFVDLLPADALRLARQRTRFRTLLLTSALAGTTVVGLAAHSFVQQRNAAATHQVASDLTRNIQDLSDMISPLTRERESLYREMTAARNLVMPVQSSDVLATITHVLPEDAVLTAVSLSLESQANPAYSAKAGAKRPKLPDPQSVSPVIPMLVGEIRGTAPDNRVVDRIATLLSATAPFENVNVEDTRGGTQAGARDFTITFTVDPWVAGDGMGSKLAQLARKDGR